jgi:hypothetical protein
MTQDYAGEALALANTLGSVDAAVGQICLKYSLAAIDNTDIVDRVLQMRRNGVQATARLSPMIPRNGARARVAGVQNHLAWLTHHTAQEVQEARNPCPD